MSTLFLCLTPSSVLFLYRSYSDDIFFISPRSLKASAEIDSRNYPC